jgi:hypothetical protein
MHIYDIRTSATGVHLSVASLQQASLALCLFVVCLFAFREEAKVFRFYFLLFFRLVFSPLRLAA